MNINNKNDIYTWNAENIKKFSASTVFIAGCGGLGSFVADSLVRSGIGKLILLDYDRVEISNLNRQVLYNENDVGKMKVDVAFGKLKGINSKLEILPINGTVEEKCDAIFKENRIDIVVDCLDNFESRFFLEEKLPSAIPLIHGGVEYDYGQVTTILKNKTPLLKEIYAGYKEKRKKIVLPQIVAIIASIMVYETLVCLIATPNLENKMIIFQLSDFSSSIVDIK